MLTEQKRAVSKEELTKRVDDIRRFALELINIVCKANVAPLYDSLVEVSEAVHKLEEAVNRLDF